MWKPNSIRQRVMLALLGLLLMASGAAVAWLSWDSTRNGLAQTRLIDTFPAQMPELGIYLAGALAMMAIILLFVMMSALPKKPGKPTFIYRSDNGTGVSTVDSRTVSMAAEEAAESTPEVDSADIRINGTAKNPVLYARFTLRADARPIDGIGLIRDVLIPQTEQALGAQFAEKHVNIDFQPKKSGPSARTTLT
ncbi:hypothetical protein [Arthrobacter sp. MYb222]|uniref:hypothetical protein n=1 Tax=Arthrobacter sp. MYb222 TaxID=1848599 RepID=UPI0011AFF6FF|nr:hypothetical protein [Arthrobacter sp. MYb222]